MLHHRAVHRDPPQLGIVGTGVDTKRQLVGAGIVDRHGGGARGIAYTIHRTVVTPLEVRIHRNGLGAYDIYIAVVAREFVESHPRGIGVNVPGVGRIRHGTHVADADDVTRVQSQPKTSASILAALVKCA